jgi:hypothetical protein
MVDPETEGANAVRLWSNAITGRLAIPNKEAGWRAIDVMYLARKYDCAAVEAAIRLLLYKEVETRTNIVSIVLFGTIFDDADLITKAIRCRGGGEWRKETAFDALGGEQVFDLATWPVGLARRIPFEYNWALARTRHLGGTHAEQADRFPALLEKAKGE